jgi:hypothetical protein
MGQDAPTALSAPFHFSLTSFTVTDSVDLAIWLLWTGKTDTPVCTMCLRCVSTHGSTAMWGTGRSDVTSQVQIEAYGCRPDCLCRMRSRGCDERILISKQRFRMRADRGPATTERTP